MRTPVLILLALALFAAGCASRAGTGAAGPTPSTAVSASPSNTSGCPAALTITADDASKTLCVQMGGTVTVNLVSADQKPWLPIDVAGAILTPAAGSPSSAATGSQVSTFTATSVGTTDITSAHRACPQKPGTVSCNAIVAWKVTVQVK